MVNANDSGATRAIPSAGPDFEHLLAQEVVIEAGEGTAKTGAQSIAPDHSPRAAGARERGRRAAEAGLLAAGAAADVQREVEQFLSARPSCSTASTGRRSSTCSPTTASTGCR
jgi:hypothetical protein